MILCSSGWYRGRMRALLQMPWQRCRQRCAALSTLRPCRGGTPSTWQAQTARALAPGLLSWNASWHRWRCACLSVLCSHLYTCLQKHTSKSAVGVSRSLLIGAETGWLSVLRLHLYMYVQKHAGLSVRAVYTSDYMCTMQRACLSVLC